MPNFSLMHCHILRKVLWTKHTLINSYSHKTLLLQINTTSCSYIHSANDDQQDWQTHIYITLRNLLFISGKCTEQTSDIVSVPCSDIQLNMCLSSLFCIFFFLIRKKRFVWLARVWYFGRVSMNVTQLPAEILIFLLLRTALNKAMILSRALQHEDCSHQD